MNGWEAGVLEKAIAETGGCNCGCACGQTEIEQCFGADNVNKDDDKSWASCSAMEAYGGEDGKHIETLPGCNPLQYGPAAATAATGAGCTAAAAPVYSNSASSIAASQTASAASSAVYSQVTPVFSAPVYSNASSAAYPTTSATVDAVSSEAYSAVLPVITFTKSHKHRHHSSTASAFPSLTVGFPGKQVDASACTDATVYKTLTEKVTVTVDASGAVNTGSY
jgi:hypothetical protein